MFKVEELIELVDLKKGVKEHTSKEFLMTYKIKGYPKWNDSWKTLYGLKMLVYYDMNHFIFTGTTIMNDFLNEGIEIVKINILVLTSRYIPHQEPPSYLSLK